MWCGRRIPHYSYSGVDNVTDLPGRYDAMEANNPEHITTTNFGTQATREYFESISYFDARLGELVRFLDRLECKGNRARGRNHNATADAELHGRLAGEARSSWAQVVEAEVYECTNPAPTPHRYDDFRSNTLIIYVTDNPAGVQQSKAALHRERPARRSSSTSRSASRRPRIATTTATQTSTRRTTRW
ncbi:MAG: hypothetical protein U0802_16070 [Candidatus Binatia bacterium]